MPIECLICLILLIPFQKPSSYDQTSICKFMPLHFANVAACKKCLDMSEDSSAVKILWHFNKSRFWNVQANVNSSKFQDTFSLTLAGGAQNISRINFRALRAQILVAPEWVWLLRSQTLAICALLWASPSLLIV